MARARLISASLLAVALAAGVVSCSSGDGDGDGNGGVEDESTTTTTTAAAPPSGSASEDGEGEEAGGEGFAMPAELRERAEAAHEVVDVDYPAQPDGVPWPTEEWERGELPPEVAAEVDRIVQADFDAGDEYDHLDAVLIVHDGRLVYEAYNGWDPEERHNSWSMAKSMTAAMVGILERQGRIDIFEPARAAEWREPGDPRGEITLDQLLRMSSGLEWEESYTDPDGDVLTIVGADATDRAGYTAAKPLADPLDTVWEYSTGTSDVVAREVAYEVGFGPDYEAWIQEELFDPLGIPGADHQFDGVGVTNGGSWINLRAEDFARFGLLFLRGGEWDGQTIVDQEWVDYSRQPTPTSEDRDYGAQWWLEEDEELPEVFHASGFNGQSITVMPTQDVVLVILSNSASDRDEPVRQELLDVLKPLRPAS